MLKGHGYDFAKSRDQLAKLPIELSPGTLAELDALLKAWAAARYEPPHSVEELANALLEHVPQLISIQFNALVTAAD
eukprot:4898858-Prymnesium_polylepis.1